MSSQAIQSGTGPVSKGRQQSLTVLTFVGNKLAPIFESVEIMHHFYGNVFEGAPIISNVNNLWAHNYIGDMYSYADEILNGAVENDAPITEIILKLQSSRLSKYYKNGF